MRACNEMFSIVYIYIYVYIYLFITVSCVAYVYVLAVGNVREKVKFYMVVEYDADFS